MVPFELIVRPRARWLSLAALGLVGVVAVAAAPRATGHAPARVAIRVACERPADCALVEALAVDVWSEERGPGVPLDVVVMSDRFAELRARGVTWQVLVPDIDAVAAAEAARLRDPANRPADWFAEYHDFAGISAKLEELQQLAPDRAALQAIGASLEGRPIWALRIGKGATPMLISGTLHAREWIASAVSMCVADRLVRDYDRDPAIRAFVDRTQLWIVPVDNPDGYERTWRGDRYWRKNVRDGHGVDLNRNFAVGFGGQGSSRNKRAETYHGAYAFSEPESAALRDLIRRHAIARYIDFHAYGQLVLYPWSYTGTPAPDRERLAGVGDRMTSALVAAHGTPYKLSSAIEFYPSAGTAIDYAYAQTGALSYVIELRPAWPRGAGGFVLPPAQIRPTCDEGLAAVLALGQP